jgi:Tol biopolymer transport system component
VLLGNGSDIYVYDLERDTTTQLTFTGAANWPSWSPDGRHIVYGFGTSIFLIRSDGSGDPQRLMERPGSPRPWSFAPDGHLAYFERNSETGFDIGTLPVDLTDPDHPKPGKPEPFLSTPADELVPRFSPDGRWIAYRSNEAGIPEIYVRPFPASGGSRWKISSGGGMYAFWSKDRRELFYETAENRIMVAEYTVDGATFVPGKSRPWSDKQLFYIGSSNLDLAPDGKRFAAFDLNESLPARSGSVHVTVLENFFDELKRKLP